MEAHALTRRLLLRLGRGGRDEERFGAGVLGPLFGERGALPRQIEVTASEVAVGGDLTVDRPAQARGRS